MQRDAGKKVGMIQEVWRKHERLSYTSGFEIEVSNLGLVRRAKGDGNFLYYTPQFRNKGTAKRNHNYWYVQIKGEYLKIHQLVWEAFFGAWWHTEKVIDHINGISLDNRLVNLQLLDPLQNAKKQDRDDSKGLF